MSDGRLVERLPLEDSVEELYEHAPCGYVSTAPDGRIVRVNETFLTWTGLTRESVHGRRFQDLLTAGGRIFHETHVGPMLRVQGAVRELALELECATGTLPIVLNAVVKHDDGGRPQVVRMTVFDARERRSHERELVAARRAERAARERSERLQRLTAGLVAAADAAGVARIAADELRAALGADGAVVVLTTGGRREVAGQSGVPVDPPDPPEATFERGRATVPLEAHGRRFGLVAVALPAARALADEERAFLLTAAAQCAQAFDRALLHEATIAAAARAALLARISRAVAELQSVAERAEMLVGALVPEVADGARVDVTGDPPVIACAGAAPAAAPAAPPRLEATVATLPLRARGRPVGTLVLARAADRPFAAEDFSYLRDVADLAALTFDNARVIEQERGVADVLQRRLFSGEVPRDARLAVATHYRAAVEGLEVGGDWYDAFPLDATRMALVVGDVVGRGLQAASVMGQLRSAIRALATVRLGPAAVLSRLDDFVDHEAAALMATVVFAELDLDSGAVRYACAGHLPPVRCTATRTELLWGGRSAPLGARGHLQARPEAETTLARGERLVLYTDGLVERRRVSLDERLDALVDGLARRRERPLADAVDAVVAELLADAPSDDDVCVLAVART